MLQILQSVLSRLLLLTLHLQNSSSFPPPLPAAKERELLERYRKTGDRDARALLIEHNLRLVAHIMKKYYAAESDQEDLVSIGTIGLIKAVDSFDPDKGTRLATYAARCIENEILMHFRARRRTAGTVSLSEPMENDSEGNHRRRSGRQTQNAAAVCLSAGDGGFPGKADSHLPLRSVRRQRNDPAGACKGARNLPVLCFAA